MPDPDMSAERGRSRRSGPSDEVETPGTDRGLLPGMMEAGQGGGGRADWGTMMRRANGLSGPAQRAMLEKALEAAKDALASDDDAEAGRAAGAVDQISARLGTPASGGSGTVRAPESGRVEIPGTERQLKLFLRQKIREVVRVTSNDDALTLETVRSKVIQGLGFDPKTFTPVDLFSRLPENVREKVREDTEGEILARCTLRAAELREISYKGMADKGAAVNRYMNDMKGSESGGASAAVLDRDTFLWLKELDDLGDGLSSEKVDRAFAVFVMLGEKDPDFSAPWLREFEPFRPKKVGVGGAVTWGTNYYDPAYDRKMKVRVNVKMEEVFGKDAAGLAWQMFQAFKEEGNYNWQHYLSRDFTFAANRHSLATLLTPPVYIGSRRVYVTGTGTHKDELERTALSALRVTTKVREVPDPSTEDPTKTKDLLERDVFLNRARKGKFLVETPFGDQSVVKEGKMPQQLSYNTVKDGERFRGAVVAVGELGKDADKNSKVGAAVGALADLRSYGQSLVDARVITQEELDRQVETEARNVVWELDTENPTNVQDLAVQSKGKQNFLTPSGLNSLFQAIGGRTREGYFLVGSDEAYRRLREAILKVRSRTWEVFDGLGGEDEALEAREEHATNAITLPFSRGEPLVDELGRLNKFLVKAVARPVSGVVKPIADILFPKSIFRGRK